MRKSILVMFAALMAFAVMGCNNTIMPEVSVPNVETEEIVEAKGMGPDISTSWNTIAGIKLSHLTFLYHGDVTAIGIGSDKRSIYSIDKNYKFKKVYTSSVDVVDFLYMRSRINHHSGIFLTAEGKIRWADYSTDYPNPSQIVSFRMGGDTNYPLLRDFTRGNNGFYGLSKDGRTIYEIGRPSYYSFEFTTFESLYFEATKIESGNELWILRGNNYIYKIQYYNGDPFPSYAHYSNGMTDLGVKNDAVYYANGSPYVYNKPNAGKLLYKTDARKVYLDGQYKPWVIMSGGGLSIGTPRLVKLYAGGDEPKAYVYLGDYDLVNMSAYGIPNDTLTKIWVPKGYDVTLYQHHHYLGTSKTFAGPTGGYSYGKTYDLADYGWSKTASSMKITKQ